jgi:tetratricopeptide (TPR) repeat protein
MTDNHLLLYRLAELMLEQERHIMAVDDLFDDDRIGAYVKSIQIDSPYQQMLFEGVLTESVRDEKLFVNFTVEGYFHYVLGEVIFDSFRDSELRQLVDSNRLNGVREGVSQCLIRHAERSNFDVILDFIDAGADYGQLCIVPLGMALVNADTAELLRKLLDKESEEDYRILDAVLQFLSQNNRHQTVDKVWMHLIPLLGDLEFTTAPYYKARIIIHGIGFKDDEFIDGLTDRIIESGKSSFKSFKGDHKTTLLVDYYNLLVGKGMLPKAYRFAMRVGVYDVPSPLLVDNYYNILYPLLELGKFKKAERVYLLCEPQYSMDGFFLNWSGWIYQSWYELKSGDMHHLDKGLELYKRSSALIDASYGRYSLRKYQNLENLGYTYTLIQNYDLGLQYLDQAIEIVSKSYQTDITYSLGNLYEMKAKALSDTMRFDDALAFMDKSDRCKLLQVGPDTSEMSWNYETRANILLAMGNKAEANNALKRALNIREAELGYDNELTQRTRSTMNALSS